jgi:CHAT domain-containing protein
VSLALLWLPSTAGGGALTPAGTPPPPPGPAASPDSGAASTTGPQPNLDDVRRWNDVGRCAEAERTARSLLADAERAHGPESAEAAEILDELAVALRRGGKTADPEALEICERSLRIREQLFGAHDPRYATSLYNFGVLQLRRKDYRRALPVLEQCLEIRARTLGDRDPAVAQSLRSLGAVQHALGDFLESLALTERAFAIEQGLPDMPDADRALGMTDLANARYGVGDYAGAIPLLEGAIGLWERQPAPYWRGIADCCHLLGVVHSSMGDKQRGRRYLERALLLRETVAGVESTVTAVTLMSLGQVLGETGDFAAARSTYLRAVRIYEERAPHDPDLGWCRMKLAWLYLDAGDLARARDLLRQALREQAEALGPGHADTWLTLLGLARVAGQRGEADTARVYFERTVDVVISTSGPKHPDLGQTLLYYSSFHLDEGDSMAAFNTALRATGINREHLRLTARGTAERQALLYTSWLKTGVDVAIAALSGTLRAGDSDYVRRAWDAVIHTRAVVLDEVAERARIAGAAGELSDLARRLENARDRLANLLVRGPTGESAEKTRTLMDRAYEDVDRAERALAARSAAFRSEQGLAALGFEQVASALPPMVELVSFVGYGPESARSYGAFVLGRDRKPRFVPLGPAKEIDRMIAHWRRLAGTPPVGVPRGLASADAACRSAGQGLRTRMWDPVASGLAGSGIVLVVPDGPIHLLNLAALPIDDGGYLAEFAAIHYLSAERGIVAAGGAAPRGVGLLALGGASFDGRETPASRDSIQPTLASAPAASVPAAPVYRTALRGCETFRSFRFEPLPATTREVDEISQSWARPEETVVLKGRAAGEQSVKELLPGRRVAHFATHGFFLNDACSQAPDSTPAGKRGIGGISRTPASRPGRPPEAYRLQLSGLALAGANRRAVAKPEEEDGILTADEIASLDLSGLEWAVLSACDTGVGEVQSGEGVLGLRRAFEIAGARTLIMSLWPVEDRSTREWMGLLYEGRFRRGLETAEAVRQANLGVLKSRKAQGLSTHPFYWAAFVAAGGWK